MIFIKIISILLKILLRFNQMKIFKSVLLCFLCLNMNLIYTKKTSKIIIEEKPASESDSTHEIFIEKPKTKESNTNAHEALIPGVILAGIICLIIVYIYNTNKKQENIPKIQPIAVSHYETQPNQPPQKTKIILRSPPPRSKITYRKTTTTTQPYTNNRSRLISRKVTTTTTKTGNISKKEKEKQSNHQKRRTTHSIIY